MTPLFTSPTTSATAAFEVVATDDHRVNSVTYTVNGSSSGITGGASWSNQPYARSGTISVPLQAGTNSVAATACDDASPAQCSTTTVQVVYQAPPSPPARQAATLSLRSHPHWHSGSLHGSTLAYATPTYISLDVPREVKLVYGSNQAAPLGFVHVRAVDSSTDAIQYLSITVKNASGVVVAPERFYRAAQGVNELAAQWDASTLPTGAHNHTVEIRSYFASGTPLVATLTARVIVLNESTPFGTGWSMVGLRRAVAQTDGVLIVNGDGTASFYEKPGTAYLRPEGETAELVAVAGGGLEQRFVDGSRLVYSSAGRLVQRVDRLQPATTYAYDGTGRLQTVTDPAGRVVTFTYTGSHITSIQTPKGTTTLSYTSGRLVSATDVGTAFQASYLTDGRLSWWLDRHGSRWDVAYDARGRLASITAPTVTAQGVSVRPVSSVRSLPSTLLPTPDSGTTQALAIGRRENPRVRSVDPLGHATEMMVDRYGQPTYVEDALGGWTSIERDADGRPRRIMDAGGNAETFRWTARGLPLEATNSRTGEFSTRTYDSLALSGGVTATVLKSIRVNGALLEYDLNGDGLPIRLRVGTDTVERRTYDSYGRVLTTTDALGIQNQYFYGTSAARNTDSIRTNTPLGPQTVRFTYDAAGFPVQTTTPLGHTTSITYDGLNRVLSTSDAQGRQATYAYAGLTQTFTDEAGKAYESTQNALGWVVSMRDPNLRTTTSAYDAAGNLRSLTDRRSQTIAFTYDALGRIATRTADGVTTTFTYDNPGGRWVAVSNAESTDTLFLDHSARDTLHVMRMGGQRYALRSTYHPSGPRTKVELTSPFSRTISYAYNPSTLQLDGVTDIGGSHTAFQYGTSGALERQVFPGDFLRRTYTYNARGLPSSVGYTNINLQGTLTRQYEYDQQDRITQMLRYWANDSTVSFGYDANGRLTARRRYVQQEYEECTDPYDPYTCYTVYTPVLQDEQLFAYDSVGNRRDPGATLAATSNRYSAFDGYTLSYDLEGNLTGKSKPGFSQTFSWNALGQLASVTTNGITVTYGYNGLGTRVRRTEGSTVTRFLYDGDDLLMELDGSGSPLREYTHLPGVDRPHAVRTGGTTYYYALDLAGNVIGTFTAAGALSSTSAFQPFGVPAGATGSLVQPLGFKGRERDARTGLYFMRARWYDPEQGRFVSEDPIGLAGGTNGYAFANNDPVNLRDPNGLAYTCEWIRYAATISIVLFTGNISGTSYHWTCTRTPMEWGMQAPGIAEPGRRGPTRRRPEADTEWNWYDEGWTAFWTVSEECARAERGLLLSGVIDVLTLMGASAARGEMATRTFGSWRGPVRGIRKISTGPGHYDYRFNQHIFPGGYNAAVREHTRQSVRAVSGGVSVSGTAAQAGVSYTDAGSSAGYTEIIRSLPLAGTADRIGEQMAICMNDAY